MRRKGRRDGKDSSIQTDPIRYAVERGERIKISTKLKVVCAMVFIILFVP